MKKDEIIQLIRQENRLNYFSGVPSIPPHSHNGIDNLPVSLASQIISGKVTLVGGAGQVVNSLIKATSTITATPTASNGSDISAQCFQGYANFGSSSGSDTRTLNYIIIL